MTNEVVLSLIKFCVYVETLSVMLGATQRPDPGNHQSPESRVPLDIQTQPSRVTGAGAELSQSGRGDITRDQSGGRLQGLEKVPNYAQNILFKGQL